MKTPRDILLARHQATMPKLDALRRSVVAELNNKETKEQSFPASLVTSLLCCSNKLWQELVWPCRRTWAGLAAVWVVLALVNVTQRDGSPAVMAKSAPSTAILLTFRDQQKILNELFADRALPLDAERPRIFSPKPRTEAWELATV
jgi:hypothetical protein